MKSDKMIELTIEAERLKRELKDVRGELINSSPFHRGDTVIYDGAKKYVLKVDISDLSKYGVKYTLTDLKKNGQLPKIPINGEYFVDLDELKNV
jgi:hypothetical protein